MNREHFQKQFGIIGNSVEIREIVDIIHQVAPTDITVLITGESGTGKEVIAKAIHQSSKRANKAMITVNAGAIPEGIIESELFGHEKGAFTGAADTRKGYFELADGGTLFLDEIGELPLGVQVKFLRVLENGEYMRVGSAISRKVNVRIIAATNKDLELAVRQGIFRNDLFFRLRSVNIRVPPLRERKEDIPLFINEFAKQTCERNGITFAGFSDEAISILKNYNWPGNVRELKNVIESIIVISHGKRIEVEDVRKYIRDVQYDGRNLPVFTHKTPEQAERELIYRALLEMKNDIIEIKNLLEQQDKKVKAVSVDHSYVETDVELEDQIKGEKLVPINEMEKRMVKLALEKFNGNRRAAAKALRISERTLYRKIKDYGLV